MESSIYEMRRIQYIMKNILKLELTIIVVIMQLRE